MAYLSIDELMTLWRPLKQDEMERARALIDKVEANLKVEAKRVNKNIDELVKDKDYLDLYKSIVCDIVARNLMTSTDQEPMIQSAESALGYSFSGTYLVPGGGLFIKKDELKRLGLRTQKYGVIDFYGKD
ncbi:phage Gp19/Gp15/Gp42 family protein [Fenollaria massiliensis]|uniref:phage Gp19/Gp15/Gp42 family protein n=1 Tax=Fenollaria massiliensis TaxID=938288 RepID=UPI00036B6760|nr:phage Gp19/Gp15/Gp42 family protein [Fenollaria massiliensis]